MELQETRAALPEVRWVEEAESTNALMREIVAAAVEPLPHGTLVATAHQTAGRGRQNRGWITPAGTALAASLLIWPDRGATAGASAMASTADSLGLSWLPLIAGSAVAAALQPLFRGAAQAGGEGTGDRDTGDRNTGDRDRSEMGAGCSDSRGSKRVGVKWPNDVHVRGEDDALMGTPGPKLCGILCEVLPGGQVVAGFGINVLQDEWQLPTERAGSLRSCGADTWGAETLADERGMALADHVLAAAATEMLRLVELATIDAPAVRRRVLRDSLTVGTEVRVHLPNGEIVDGRAVGLDDDGALVVDRPTGGQLVVHAADVEHLR